MFQVLTHQYPPESDLLQTWQKKFGSFSFYTNWKDITNDKPIICWGDLKHENVRYWLTNKYPVIYGARGYLGNHIQKRRWINRLSINGWANIKMRSIPYSRWDKMRLSRHPWKVKEVKKVLIAPSKMTSDVWTEKDSVGWVNSMLDKFPGAEVKVRYKGETPGARWATLWDELDWADLVVSLGSAITVEAFWYGKKVISVHPCNTWAAERTTLDDWQNPKEPELREQWHEHLAWSQYSDDEFISGEALEEVIKYLGNPKDINSNYSYNFFC
jgi:hypothetical protein